MAWSIPLDRLAQKYKKRIEDVTRRATFEVFSSVKNMSPVDTGRFRANWNVSYGSIDYRTSNATDAAQAQVQVNKALTLPVGGIVYMANSLPYARRLEYEGWSNQAPSGMVRVSAENFSNMVREALR